MISLTSGWPGAGKTLWTVVYVEELRKKEGREVYYHGIKELVLPWKLLDDPKEWFKCPPGSIIVIDEAQDVFPMRGPSQAVPEHVKRAATHRHNGFDLFVITQHPGKLDPAFRKDIEVHRHLMRKFGSRWATVHQWQGVRENCDKTRKDSITSTWRYPKQAFGWYKSAEVHTHKIKVPPALILAVVALVGIGLAWAHFVGRIANQASGGAGVEAAPAPSGRPVNPATMAGGGSGPGQGAAVVKTAMEYALEREPRIEGLAHTAPVYDGLTAPRTVPVPAACIQWTGKGCKCFTQTGTPYRTTEEVCVQIVRHGIFLDFEVASAHPFSGDNMGAPKDRIGPGP